MRALPLMLAMNVAAAAAGGGEFAPLTVRVNGVDQGTQLVRVDADQPCLSLNQLRALGAPEPALPQTGTAGVRVVPLQEGQGEPQDCLNAQQLAPHIALKLDVGAALLDVVVDPALLAAQSVSAAADLETLPAHYPHSAFLNYGLDLSHADADGKLDALVPLQLAIRRERWLADTTLLARDDGGVQRLFSSVTRDFPERLSALRFGDIASGGGFASAGASLLGVQWARNFAYEPLVRRTPGLDFGGVLDTPSTLEVYVDERLVTRRELPAGPYTLRDLPALSGGASTVRVEIVDAFGNRRSVEQPYYLGGGLLNAGTSEFSYNLGLPRAAIGSDRYARQPALAFAHRRGFTDRFTAGIEGEAAQRLGVIGARADLGLGLAGEVSGGMATSATHGGIGSSGYAAYRYSRQRLNVGADYSQRSANFRTLGATSARAQRTWRARLGASLPGDLNATLSYARTTTAGAVIARYGASLNGRLGRLGNLSLGAEWRTDTREPSLLVTFTGVVRSNTLAQAFVGDDAEQRQVGLRVNAAPAGYTGEGYRADVMQTTPNGGDPSEQYLGEYELRAQNYTARATRNQRDGDGDTRLGLAGSLAWTEGSLALGQPIRGSFVTVDLADIAGAEIYADGRRVGRTGSGPVLVSDLSPFLPHTLSVQAPSDLPIGIDLESTQQRFALADGGGQPLRFTSRRLRLFEGSVVRGDGDHAGAPVEFTPVTVQRDGAVAAQTVTGENGYLYLEFLAPGVYEFLVGGAKPCRFQASLPDGAETVTALGEQLCHAIRSGTARDSAGRPE